VRLPGDDAYKMLVVLRAVTGDPLEVVDSAGRLFAASLIVEGGRANALLAAQIAAPARAVLDMSLAQGIPKGPKMDYVVEKATELGISRIVPFSAARTLGDGERAGKLERWRRLAKNAAQQCGRGDVPEVVAPLTFAALLTSFVAYDLVVLPWELATPIALRERLPALLGDARSVLVVIGPEGGFSEDEARAAEGAGAELVSLGCRILRTETAGLVATSVLRYVSGDL